MREKWLPSSSRRRLSHNSASESIKWQKNWTLNSNIAHHIIIGWIHIILTSGFRTEKSSCQEWITPRNWRRNPIISWSPEWRNQNVDDELSTLMTRGLTLITNAPLKLVMVTSLRHRPAQQSFPVNPWPWDRSSSRNACSETNIWLRVKAMPAALLNS